MGLHAHHIGELVGEIGPLVAGARVRDVAPRPPRDLLLVLERDGGVRRLLVSADPEAGRIHLQSGRLRPHRGSVGPFFRLVADLLVGGTVRTLAQVDGDRIARLTVEGEEGAVHLVAELTGRHANLVLLDRRERVLGMLVPPPPGPPARRGWSSASPGAHPPAAPAGARPQPWPPTSRPRRGRGATPRRRSPGGSRRGSAGPPRSGSRRRSAAASSPG